MKSIVSLIVLSLAVSTAVGFSLNGDFISGFESGIFLRDDPAVLDDYGCK